MTIQQDHLRIHPRVPSLTADDVEVRFGIGCPHL